VKMTVNEALDILGIAESPVTKEMIKSTHRRLLSKYHPDRNPDGHVMAQKINIARDFLFTLTEPIRPSSNQSSYQNSYRGYSQPFVKYVRGMIVTKEYEYAVTYVSGNTFRFREVLKEHWFKWNPDEKRWWRDGLFPIEEYLAKANLY